MDGTSRPRLASSAAGRSTAATAPRRRPLCTCCLAANASSLLRKSASAAGCRGRRDSRKLSARFALTIAETLDNTPRLGRSDSNQSSPRSRHAPMQPVPSRRARSPAGRAGGGGTGAARAMGGATGGVIGGACWARVNQHSSMAPSERGCRVNQSGRARLPLRATCPSTLRKQRTTFRSANTALDRDLQPRCTALSAPSPSP